MANKTTPKVSIVIPFYNLGKYVSSAVQSVMLQTYKNWQIIIVDDGSTERESVKALKQLKYRYPNIEVVTQKNGGLSNARNTGIRLAVGEYIVCLDADDKLHPEYLRKTVAKLDDDKTGEVGFITTWIQEFGKRNNIYKTAEYDADKLLIENVVHAGSLFRKSVWNEVGGYKEEMKGGYEDWEFWLNIVEKGYSWDIVPEPLFRYRIRSNSMLSVISPEKHLELYDKLYELHSEFFEKHLHALALGFAQKIKDLHSVISEKDASIMAANSTLHQSREQVAALMDELDQLHLSRVTGSAIKVRDKLLKGRIKAGAAKVRTKRGIKKLVPAPIKRAGLREIRKRNTPHRVTIANEQWKSNSPLISIVTPFYNQSAIILETVQSILTQTYAAFEYIIVDDGSDIGESKILDSINDKRVTILRHDKNIGNGSPAAARNSGINTARGKYIVCLDADDVLEPTYIEKSLVILETNPSISLSTSDTQMFGHRNESMQYRDYDPQVLLHDNMIITAAMFLRKAWEQVGGYKTTIGYEDWEFWINLAEHGFFGKHIEEKLFYYRTAPASRYIEDKLKHRDNLDAIRSLHPSYRKLVNRFQKSASKEKVEPTADTAFINLKDALQYHLRDSRKPNILILIPWMPFGGAESLIYSFCNEIKDKYNVSFITGLKDANEWEYRFREITPNIYHLANLFDDERLYVEFISNYIITRKIDVIHIIHTNFVFSALRELKKRHPDLKIILSMFNDRVPAYFNPSVALSDCIDLYVTDNAATANHYKNELPANKVVKILPNGIDCYNEFNPDLFNRSEQRKDLGVSDTDLVVFFAGRLSEEKNPEAFLQAAEIIVKHKKIKNVKFFVVGDGVKKPIVESMIKAIDSNNVQYLGYQSAVARYLSAADIFVLPSTIDGFPAAILEAMAMEKVIIASRIGAIPDVIETGKNGFVIPIGSVDEIADRITEVNNHRDLIKSMGELARKRVETSYSIEVLGKNYDKLYRQLLEDA